MPLYHYKLGFPDWYERPSGKIRLVYGNHAKSEATLDKYCVTLVQLPNPLDLDTFWPVEIEAKAVSGDPCVVKTVYRGPLDQHRDLCLVIDHGNFVRTIWVNHKLDGHATLRRGKYETPRNVSRRVSVSSRD